MLHRRQGPKASAHLLLPPHVLPASPQPGWLHLLCDQPESKLKGNQLPEEKVAVSLCQIIYEQGGKNTDGMLLIL